MGKLYVVATPIGNLGDITYRAVQVLKEANIIACEDTRRTGILLAHYEIEKPLISFHQHSRLQKIDYLISLIRNGKDIALVTDAGTPGISDPGGVLIEEAIKNKIEVEPIPGASAVVTLLSIAGIDASKFLFLGYLPKKKGRQTLLRNMARLEYPVVLYESPHRVKRTLEDIKQFAGDRELVIGRELTKKFSEVYRGPISKVFPLVKEQGEFTLIIYNAAKES